MRSQLETELEYQKMVMKKRYYAYKLYQLVRKNCNGSTYIVVDNTIRSFLESMCNVLLIREDDFKSLLKYLKKAAHRIKVLDEAGFKVAKPKFHYAVIEELENRDQ